MALEIDDDVHNADSYFQKIYNAGWVMLDKEQRENDDSKKWS